jgi:hypothetical protein
MACAPFSPRLKAARPLLLAGPLKVCLNLLTTAIEPTESLKGDVTHGR